MLDDACFSLSSWLWHVVALQSHLALLQVAEVHIALEAIEMRLTLRLHDLNLLPRSLEPDGTAAAQHRAAGGFPRGRKKSSVGSFSI